MAAFKSYDPNDNDIQIGDLIEIDRGNYSHWALCGVIDEKNVVWCFHVSKIGNTVPRISTNKRACIRYDKLIDILNRIDTKSKYRVNNQTKKAAKILDNDITRMPDMVLIINILHSKIGEEVEYDPKDQNCEHYATSWKYGTGFSGHSKTTQSLVNLGFATATGIGGATCLGAVGLTAAGFTSAGIAGGSIAAAIQGPAVVAGSTFAVLQSLGATGTIVAVGAGAAAFTLPVAVIGGAYYLYSRRRKVCAEYNK